ncbi:Ribosomal RNA processing protein 1A [Galemys pyrenaicus]|uniref:Ribosomal RNA processing protein 1A n=1 Tax=Galemys pyrenaicus TaxID=202257 RepID=A0A8J5ZU16_GALPY|nr:Ribosomal RNA processing protein 1A [Galemys pyrenaicus]
MTRPAGSAARAPEPQAPARSGAGRHGAGPEALGTVAVMVSRVQLPPEVQLAQRLAGNEQVTRDRAVRRLRKYIVARTQKAAGRSRESEWCWLRAGGFTHDELLKIWKGLFYCMWMQDQPLLQEELGRTISQLIHAFQTVEAQHLFLQTFWQTMNREWVGIDRLRLDKFYLLMRLVLRESLEALRTRAWEGRETEQLLELLTTEILHPDSQAPNGVKSHFLEVFLEELTKVGAAELTADQNLRLIAPFFRIAAQTREPLVLHNITRGVFEAIVEQAPLAIEDLMAELDAQEDGGEGGRQEGRATAVREACAGARRCLLWAPGHSQHSGHATRVLAAGAVRGADSDTDSVEEPAGDDDKDSARSVLQVGGRGSEMQVLPGARAGRGPLSKVVPGGERGARELAPRLLAR